MEEGAFMIVEKWVTVEKEVEVEISTEDIAAAIREDPDFERTALTGLDNAYRFIREIPDAIIEGLSDDLKNCIVNGFGEQMKRFS